VDLRHLISVVGCFLAIIAVLRRIIQVFEATVFAADTYKFSMAVKRMWRSLTVMIFRLADVQSGAQLTLFIHNLAFVHSSLSVLIRVDLIYNV
jgi:hypothetical protein